MSDSLAVRGGQGGTAARLEDLDRAGAQLERAARALTSVARRATRIAADPALAASAVRSPTTWLAAERQLARAVGPPAGVVAVAVRLAGLGISARAAARVYRAADAGAAAGLHAVDALAGRVSAGLIPLVMGTSLLPTAAVRVVIGEFWLAERRLPDDATGDPPGRVDVVPQLLHLLAAHPGLVEHAVDALPGAIGAVVGIDAGAALGLFPVTRTLAVPSDVPGGARWLARFASAGPWLRETGSVKITSRPVAARAPAGTAGIVQGVESLDPSSGAEPGTVRVVLVRQADGSRAWIAQIPGTQDWSPRAGRNPFDLTGNIQGMAGSPTAGRRLVDEALRAAGARPGEPVLLAGHSQGGLVAAQLAADPQFRASHRVTHVVTVGAPVGSVPVPDSVAVLSLEHEEDLIPRLDGAPNPDRPRWITVSRATTPSGGVPDPSVAHDLSTYTATSEELDGSADPGLTRWRESARPFLDGPGVSATGLEVTGIRSLPPAPAPG